jgi:hypothetical protein
MTPTTSQSSDLELLDAPTLTRYVLYRNNKEAKIVNGGCVVRQGQGSGMYRSNSCRKSRRHFCSDEGRLGVDREASWASDGSIAIESNFLPAFTVGTAAASPFHHNPVLTFLTGTSVTAPAIESASPSFSLGQRPPPRMKVWFHRKPFHNWWPQTGPRVARGMCRTSDSVSLEADPSPDSMRGSNEGTSPASVTPFCR